MTILLAIIFFIAGLAIGSFLNVCIDRLPARKSLAYPPSHCDSCEHDLSAADLVPVFSYLFLRGRCRYCKAKIPVRVPIVEGLTGLLFLAAFWRYGLTAQFGVTAFWACVFLVIIFIDKEHQLILNIVTLPAAIAAIVILGADSLFPQADIMGDWRIYLQPSIFSGIVAGAIGFVFFLVVYLINPRGMGLGDVKLAGVIGLAAGFPLGIIALFTGILLGGLSAVVLLILRKKGRKDVMPYGVFLGTGPIIVFLFGNEILEWYLRLF